MKIMRHILMPLGLPTLALGVAGCVSDYAEPYPLLDRDTDRQARTIPVFPENMVGPPKPASAADADEEATGLEIPDLLARERAYRLQPIALRDVRDSVVRDNLGLESDRLSAASSAEQVGVEQGYFAAVLGVEAGYSQTVSSGTSVVSPSGSWVSQSPGIETDLTLPLATGGSLELSSKLYEYRTDPNNLSFATSPSSGAFSSLMLSASQPLLRGGGTTVALAPIALADYTARQDSANVTVSLLSTLTAAEVKYWQSWVAGQVLEVRESTRDLALEQLELTESLLENGQATIVDVEVARASLFSQIQQMVQAEQQYVTTALDLQSTMNQPDLPLDGSVLVVPDEGPSLPTVRYDLPSLLDMAMENRLELLQLELAVASDALQIEVARNETLPKIDVGGEFGVTGVTASGVGQALKDTFNGSQPFPWAVGVTGSVYLDNQMADSQLRAAILDRLASIADLGSQRLTIKSDVLSAVANLRAAETQIRLSRRSALAYQQAYDGTVELFRLGQQDANDVAEALENLASALSNMATQYGAYQEGVVQLAAATGTNLGMNAIEWTLPTASSPTTESPDSRED